MLIKRSGKTILHFAAIQGNTGLTKLENAKTAKLLIDAGALIQVQDK